ncbi:glycine cleavage T C-terminal barrel domain-containing protein [Streptomyces flavofungini]|uniref:glycine cleavage T C-terminal barrel domain-containing protein n=1 Tax=Streptomyces flavofungini TaxID=68200 RepID=UPI0025B0A8FB|nr:glycine cleavage T C-terminal barrel domain-containing protein [Streptomyces flavofungini]WJV51030.1 glycine cleavage T C-terminal barrel domain-containing protein [Streptomyces flavofungini]
MTTHRTTTDKEYAALRQGAGLVDYDGAGLLTVTGPEATAFLGRVGTRGVDFLLEGQSTSSLLLREDGTIVAEALIHCRGTDYLLEIWPDQAPAATAHLLAAADGRTGVTVEDIGTRFTVLGIEGPTSFKIAQQYLDFPIASLSYRSCTAVTWAQTPVMLSRTGVTGEYGYKFLVPADQAASLRAELIARGAVECGREALDICRMEVRFANHESEHTGGPVTPYDIGLQWMLDPDLDHTGRKALDGRRRHAHRSPVCWIAGPGLEAAPARGTAVAVEDAAVGTVTHCVWSPRLGRFIGTAAVDQGVAASGQDFHLEGSGAAVRTVSAPFLTATSLGVPLD